MEEKAIEVKHINKSYGQRLVLKNISFSVKLGTIHGFIGPNGAGKTTVENIITGLVFPNNGEVKVGGKSVFNDPTFNENLGFIPAEPRFPNLTVEDFLLDCGNLRNIPREKVLRKLTGSPLSRFRYQKCHELSTGWKKILQVFSLSIYFENLSTKILIMDEPFNGLDPSFREDLFNNIKSIRANGGTVFLSTHVLPDLERLSVDDITMIKNGKIVYSGPRTADIEETYREHFIDKNKKGMFDL